jgi:hypothetical protein
MHLIIVRIGDLHAAVFGADNYVAAFDSTCRSALG